MTGYPQRSLVHGIQAIRGIFAVLVVCHHVGIHSTRYWGHDWLGGVFSQSTFRVDFFFVLSGFSLWTAHHADAVVPSTWKRFLAKRLVRLYPLLVILTLFKALLLVFLPGRQPDSYQLLPSLLALPQDTFPVIVAAWTLSFEMCFSVLLTICLALPRKASLPSVVAWGLLVSGAGFLLGIRPGLDGLHFLTHPFVLEFIAGVLMAEWLRRQTRPDHSPRRGWGMLLCGISLVGLCIGTTSYAWIITHAVIWQKLFWAGVFASGLAGLALWEHCTPGEKWRLRDGLGLGRASYSIFLAHGFVVSVFFALARPGMIPASSLGKNLLLLGVVVVAVLLGLLVWKCLEQPLSRVLHVPRPRVPVVPSPAMPVQPHPIQCLKSPP